MILLKVILQQITANLLIMIHLKQPIPVLAVLSEQTVILTVMQHLKTVNFIIMTLKVMVVYFIGMQVKKFPVTFLSL